ncbi:MAG: extracellular solute-binding protein [Oscillospiraceae bacterium]|nr:extracellular solute-binding protein [Oscillospiraceae bacterium]
MRKTRASAAVAAILVVFMLSAAVCSCNSGGGNIGGDASATPEPEEGTKEIDLKLEVKEELPDRQYGDAVINVLVGAFSFQDMYAPEENALTMNDAVYHKNRAVEEKLGISFNVVAPGLDHTEAGLSTAKFRLAMKAGDPAYDIYINAQAEMTSCAKEKFFYDFRELPYVDLSKPWWDKNAIADLCFGEKVYFATGDISFSTLGMTGLLLFNKNLMKNMDLEYPYELVKQGKWTYDEFAKYIKDANQDLNGDGKMSYLDDMFGLAGWQWEIGPNFYASMGGSFLAKDFTNMPVLNINTEKSYNIFAKVVDLFRVYEAYQNTREWLDDMIVFHEGRVLFIDTRPYYMDYFRSMPDDFGIIPHPKYDENQASYRQLVSNVGTYVAVPTTNSDPELASVVLEALAAESYRKVTPAYYDVVLQIKLARDNESEEMIDIIAHNRVYNVQLETFSTGNVFIEMIKKSDINLMSLYEKNEGRIKKELEKLIEDMD